MSLAPIDINLKVIGTKGIASQTHTKEASNMFQFSNYNQTKELECLENLKRNHVLNKLKIKKDILASKHSNDNCFLSIRNTRKNCLFSDTDPNENL